MTDLASLTTAEDGQNVLLLGPPLHGPTTDAHQTFLTGENPSELRVLCVTYRDSPGNVISTWQTHTDVMPAQWGIIVMGDQTRSAGTQTSPPPATASGPWIEAVKNPGDLTALGITLTQYLEEWATHDHSLVVCVDSVTALLQFVDEQTAYRFMHVATNRFRAANAVAHFHLDPDAHSEQTVAKFKSVVDTVVEVGDGDITIQRR